MWMPDEHRSPLPLRRYQGHQNILTIDDNPLTTSRSRNNWSTWASDFVSGQFMCPYKAEQVAAADAQERSCFIRVDERFWRKTHDFDPPN